MKIVVVEWVDSAFCQGWMSKERARGHQLSRICSIGILLHEDNEKITIVQDTSSDDDVGDGITIPKVSITRIRQLKVKEIPR